MTEQGRPGDLSTPEAVIHNVKERVQDYPRDPSQITIATICSHSSLQIFDAARRAGFKTLGIIKENDPAYASYDIFPYATPDDFVVVPEYVDFVSMAQTGNFDELHPIFIPHGSGVEYLRLSNSTYHGLEVLPLPTYGNRRVIPLEFSRQRQREWLEGKAGINMPKVVHTPDEINGPVILKLKGAPGGKGAVILGSREEYGTYPFKTSNGCLSPS